MKNAELAPLTKFKQSNKIPQFEMNMENESEDTEIEETDEEPRKKFLLGKEEIALKTIISSIHSKKKLAESVEAPKKAGATKISFNIGKKDIKGGNTSAASYTPDYEDV